MIIKLSTTKNKRYDAIYENGIIVHFGSKNGSTYIDHHDKIKRDNYLKRHSKLNENWDDPYSAGSLSLWLLWGDYTTLNENHKLFMKKFKDV